MSTMNLLPNMDFKNLMIMNNILAKAKYNTTSIGMGLNPFLINPILLNPFQKKPNPTKIFLNEYDRFIAKYGFQKFNDNE